MSKGFVEAVDKGLLGQVLNFAVEKAFGLPWLVNKAAEVTEGVVAGASGIMDRIASIPSGSIHATPNQTTIEGPKLGRGARDAEIRTAMETQHEGPNHASLADLFTGMSGQNFDGAVTRNTSQTIGM
jgi:hypothetical protein